MRRFFWQVILPMIIPMILDKIQEPARRKAEALQVFDGLEFLLTECQHAQELMEMSGEMYDMAIGTSADWTAGELLDDRRVQVEALRQQIFESFWQFDEILAGKNDKDMDQD